MASEQMGMPAAAPSPEEMAVFDQMRQNISPKEFSDEMLAGAEQVDPQAVAEFRQELDGLDMPPEVLDALNDLVDEILANPERYDEIRQKYISQGIPDDFLPEQFDPQFFAALNMAIDQMVGAPTGPQAFAKGGIAELKPIAKAIASYGRNGDTMLAHITPAEARMLKRRGGSGTINPDTGLPEFFLKKAFKSIGKALKKVGNAVKKFASSTVGRLVTTVALGFFLGPAAATMLGATSAAGVAAVSGFVGSAGSTLLAGGNLRDALKAGAVGGLTAGAGAGIMGGSGAFQAGSYTGPTTVGGQFERLQSAFSPTPLQQAAPTVQQAVASVPAGTEGAAPLGVQTATQAPVPDTSGAFIEPGSGPMGEMPAAKVPMPYDPATATRAVDYGYKPGGPEGITDRFKGYLDKISPSKIQETGAVQADLAGQKAMEAHQARMAAMGKTATAEGLEQVYQTARKAAMPGVVGTYGPMAAVGIGALGMAGGFSPKPAPMTLEAQMMRDRLQREEQMMRDNPGMFTPQGFGRFGAQYNPQGQITGWNPWSPASAGAFEQYYNPLRFPEFAPPVPPRGFAKGGIAHLASGGIAPGSAQYVENVKNWFAERPNATYEDIQSAIQYYGLNPEDVRSAMDQAGLSKAVQYAAFHQDIGDPGNVPETYGGTKGISSNINYWLSQYPSASVTEMRRAMNEWGLSDDDIRRATGLTPEELRPTRVPPSRVPETPYYVDQSPMPAPTVIPQPPAPQVPEQPAAIPWNLMPDFQRYIQATYGTPIRPTWSVLGNEVQGTQDPFGAAKRTPIYSQMAPFPNRAPGISDIARDSSINLPMYTLPPVKKLPKLGQGWGISFDPGDMGPPAPSPAPAPAVAVPAPIPPLPTVFPQEPVMGAAQGGIAALSAGGYPRRTGQIDGPGTETSDSIPAMLSDGEFVMTAKAVRGAGNGSRREGAKKMYALMHRLEKNAARG